MALKNFFRVKFRCGHMKCKNVVKLSNDLIFQRKHIFILVSYYIQSLINRQALQSSGLFFCFSSSYSVLLFAWVVHQISLLRSLSLKSCFASKNFIPCVFIQPEFLPCLGLMRPPQLSAQLKVFSSQQRCTFVLLYINFLISDLFTLSLAFVLRVFLHHHCKPADSSRHTLNTRQMFTLQPFSSDVTPIWIENDQLGRF